MTMTKDFEYITKYYKIFQFIKIVDDNKQYVYVRDKLNSKLRFYSCGKSMYHIRGPLLALLWIFNDKPIYQGLSDFKMVWVNA